MSAKKIQLLVFAPSLYFSFYFNAKIRVFKFLKFHVERLCRCEGNMDSQGEFMRLVVLCVCWECVFLCEGCGVLPECSWSSVTCL